MLTRRQRYISIMEIGAIVLICGVVYLSNGLTIASSDSIPNSLLAFNVLEHHTLNFNLFREAVIPSASQPYYFFVEAANGQLTSPYPIGTAIVTFPLYLLFYLYLKISHIPINLVDGSFDAYRLLFEKLAATTISTLSVVGFYLASRLKFDRGISLISTGIFAFATNTWVTSSQALWQHGSANFMVLIAMASLFVANRHSGRWRVVSLLVAGIAVGLLPSIRPTSLVFVAMVTLYIIRWHRNGLVPYGLGLLSILPGVAWNLYYFGSIAAGGYSRYGSSLYSLSVGQLFDGVLGLLVSPSRGLLIFSPILLYAIPGLFTVLKTVLKPPQHRDEQLVIYLSIGSALLFLNYGFYTIWWAGHGYGPRFMTDIMPVCCYLFNYTFSSRIKVRGAFWGETPRISLIVVVLLAFSVLTQAVGAFGLAAGAAGRTAPTPNFWNEVPLDIDSSQARRWNWQDNQISRHVSSVTHRLFSPPVLSSTYQQQLQGNILDIRGSSGEPLGQQFACVKGSVELLTAQVQNTGRSVWFGYLAALTQGEARVRVTYYTAEQRQLAQGKLYIADSVFPNRKAEALGLFPCPAMAGAYYIVFDLVTDAIGEIPLPTEADRQRLIYQLQVVDPT